MSHQLINRSDDLRRLFEEGYDIQIKDGYLLVRQIPYLDQNGRVSHGVFACPINATSQSTLPPQDHVMSFSGGMPHDQHGNPLDALGLTPPQCSEIDGLKFQHGFSNKPRGRSNYNDFYEKVATYAAIIYSPVQAVDPSVTVKVSAHV